ncbi:Protein translocase subunit SecF [BD1-7 clade bacterium]|uniref:Protein-export membrane protein SecF n=1 Tax=BD1-7 clade bacterium TaxID=2029982 RepID=A0A5S9QEC7_9GAMM|nr:Protein translocase subunit SecF [BD1-7 clade bacterium]CAA0100594.1 Protein translocase subunit SecF [BD1-7 clade bacterium]CAA0116234.1 Protein translocase subunit SecF [BD1-7 clade bacterium]
MKSEKIYNFMGRRYIALGLSVTLLLVSIVSLAVRGLDFGLDFTGGTLIELGYQKEANLSQVREDLEGAGYENAVVQFFGADTDVLVRLQSDDPKLGDKISTLLQKDNPGVELRRVEFVGPQVGEELKEQGGLAMLLALAVVLIYIAMRFQFKFGIGAVGALVHDVIITLGAFSLFQWEFDLTVLAAVLAVIGYSLNDTIVVCDRIRENFRDMRKGESVEVINASLTQTLSRTLMTSITTLIVLIVLFFAGGEMISGFAVALIIGVTIGTYSSIYVAANILLLMHVSREDLIVAVVEKEGEEFDEMP